MPLGTKELFDTMLSAAEKQDMDTLEKRKAEFMEDAENFSKCVDANGDTLLHKALAANPAVLLYVLGELGGKVDAKNGLGKTALHEAAKRNHVQCVNILLEKGSDPLAANEVGSTAFHTACACGSLEVMEVLLKQEDIDVNLVDGAGCYPIHKCAYDGNERVFDLLLKHDANVDVRDAQECTAIHIAVKMNRLSYVKKLLDVGEKQNFDINAGDKSGNTLLHYAVTRCLHDMVTELISRGAEINKPNEDGNTPLHVAAMAFKADSQEWEDLILELLRQGADHSATNELPGRANGRKPVDYVNRNVAFLFDPKEYQKRDAEIASQQEKVSKFESALEEEKKKHKEEIRRIHKERERVRREVVEQRRKEEEERQREEEARQRKEDEERAKELEEMEAKKKGKKGKRKD
eukprot:TRINITY_DN5081_c0_g1_i1.p1 TRINITY_DN5081_c0_g1~~TRINITY_DN5081_c0_g1_i1.p1  ORF type:complete len:406 (+),score=138.39 TRINITY_DN5081_c0_g1_i1:1219-2436(+)